MFGMQVEVRGNTEKYVKKLYDINGNNVGTISITRPKKAYLNDKKKKSVLYSFKQVSSQVMKAKTSVNAAQVSRNIGMKIGLLQRQLKKGDCDEEEILRAILHAKMVKKACEKKKKNLELEETAERKLDGEEEIPAESIDSVEEADSKEEMRELEAEEFKALMEKLEISIDEMYDMAEETVEFDEELDEMSEVISGAMTPERLKELKQKHRSEETAELLSADLKYLKALFDRLQSEKENNVKGNYSKGYESGVSVSFGDEIDIPVMSETVQSNELGGTIDMKA